LNVSTPLRSDNHGGPLARIILVEKTPLLRDGIRACLVKAGGIELCGEASDAAEAEWMASTLQPDLAIVGVDASEPAILDFIEELTRRPNAPKVIVLLAYDGPPGPTASLFRRGASAVLSKQVDPDELVQAVRNVLAGRTYLSAETIEHLVRRRNRAPGGVG
jgi:DNA-binding NarL/FixJ family response regulator